MSGLLPGPASHINNLPPELLTRIFLGLRNDSVKYEWLQVTSVCKYWREVAIGFSRLWTDIQIPAGFDAEVVKVALSRSNQAALQVSVACQDEDSDLDSALRILCEHSRRIEYLSVTIQLAQSSIVTMCLQSLGPALHELHLKGIIPNVARGSLPSLDHVSLQEVELPRLKTLHLDGILVDAPDALFAQLERIVLRKTEPALSRLDRGARSLLFPDYMRKTLAACVNAESVCIEEAFDRESVLAWEPVHLPRLQRLYILDMCFGTRKVLRMFKLSPTAAVHVTSVPECALIPQDTLARGCFTTTLPTRGGDQTTRLRREGTRRLAFSASDASWRVKGLIKKYEKRPETPWSASVLMPEQLDGEAREAHLRSAFHELGSLVRPRYIKVLDIHVAPHLGNDYPWMTLLREFSNVHSLKVGGVAATTTLLDAVASAATDSGEEPLARVSSMRLCLREITPTLEVAFRRCIEAHKATSLRILPASVVLRHIPPDPPGDDKLSEDIVTIWLGKMKKAFSCLEWSKESERCRACQGITS
ncbi:hypothetical protein C8Q70DRAFT_943462 [Cubamyces menziesii]|nr:hypothetical protein C8Q70DRAFT_943462 [Cubamyces menziesii]